MSVCIRHHACYAMSIPRATYSHNGVPYWCSLQISAAGMMSFSWNRARHLRCDAVVACLQCQQFRCMCNCDMYSASCMFVVLLLQCKLKGATLTSIGLAICSMLLFLRPIRVALRHITFPQNRANLATSCSTN